MRKHCTFYKESRILLLRHVIITRLTYTAFIYEILIKQYTVHHYFHYFSDPYIHYIVCYIYCSCIHMYRKLHFTISETRRKEKQQHCCLACNLVQKKQRSVMLTHCTHTHTHTFGPLFHDTRGGC